MRRIRTKRVIATFETERNENVIRLTELLSQTLDAEVLGLYVEDEELLSAAALPFTRTVSFGGGQVQTFEPADLERAYRVGADLLRRSFGSPRGLSRANWSIEVVRGSRETAAVARGVQTDLVVLAPRRRLSVLQFTCTSARCSVAFAPSTQARAAQPLAVAVYYRGEAPILRIAARLAEILGVLLHVLVVDDDSGRAAALERRARAWLRRNAASGKVSVLKAEAAHGFLGGMGSGVLLSAVPAAEDVARLEDLTRELDGWSLVLLRG